MSFLVSFNGQFTPYIHSAPDVWHGRVSPVNKLEAPRAQEINHHAPETDTIHHPPKARVNAYEQQTKSFEKSKKRIYARDIMSSPSHFVFTTTPLSEAMSEMKKFGFRHILVFNSDEKLAGIISDRELIGARPEASCESVMIPKVLVGLQDSRIQDMAHLMLQEKINALPIINDKHVVVGIITQSDILRYVIGSEEFIERG